jgi:hypothetical protein
MNLGFGKEVCFVRIGGFNGVGVKDDFSTDLRLVFFLCRGLPLRPRQGVAPPRIPRKIFLECPMLCGIRRIEQVSEDVLDGDLGVLGSRLIFLLAYLDLVF